MASVRPPPASSIPPEAEDDGGTLRRLGARVGAAVAAALLAAFPPALRILRHEPAASLPWTWAVLAGSALVPLALLMALVASSRRGARGFAADRGAAPAFAVTLWAGLLFPFLLVLGMGLRATTHHHALAGVTFAIVGLAGGLGLALVATRLARSLVRVAPVRLFVLLVVVEMLLVTVLALRGMARAPVPGPTASLVVDVFAAVLAGLLALRFAPLGQRMLALVGPPLGICLLVVALSAQRSRVGIAPAVHAQAPLYAPLFVAPGRPLTPEGPVLSSPDGAPSGALP